MATTNGKQITSTAANPNTTRTASGAVKAPMPKVGAETGSQSVQTALREYVPELQLGRQALQTYETMYRSDAQVRTTLRAAFTPVLSADASMEPYSPNPDDLLIGSFCDWNILGGGLNETWTRVLSNLVKCLYLGSTVLEQVWLPRVWVYEGAGSQSKNYLTLQKLAERPINTILQYNYDQFGGPNGVTQTKYNPSDPNSSPEEVDIPIEKLCIAVWDQQGADLRGLSVLRSAYQHWFYKTNFYKIDGVQKERHGIGVPLIKLPPGYDEEDLTFAQNLGRNIRTNERAYILQPPGWEISFAKIEGNLVDALDSAVHHDLMIARNILVQFINQGSQGSSSGSRSSGAVMLDLFLSSAEFFARMLADCINRYVIPQLVSYNFNVDKYPTLKFKSIGGEKDKQAEAAAFRNLCQAGLITATPETEQWMRSYFGIPQASDMQKYIDMAQKNAKQIKNATGVDPSAQVQQDGSQQPGQQNPGTKPPTGGSGKGTTQG